MRFINLLLVIICVLIWRSGLSQDPPPDGLAGEDLRTWLRDNWYMGHHNSVGYNNARQEMYSYIDNEGGNVFCVYSGFFQEAEFTTYLNPINAEHTVPQALFNSNEPMKSDVHHIFPTHQDVNSARGNLPFEDIDDPVTDDWYIGDGTGITTSSTIPSFNIDQYSERDINDSFEPREDHKGNVARAIFYFFTMYPTQGGSITQLGEIMELYQWHSQDPVDDQEMLRNDKTQEIQGNYNPYISMPELVQLAWDIPSSVASPVMKEFKMFPNPAFNEISFSPIPHDAHYEIYDTKGRLVKFGRMIQSINISEMEKGVYWFKLYASNSRYQRKLVKL